MKRWTALGAFMVLAFVPALADAHPPLIPPAGPGSPLAEAAHDLTYSTQQLTEILSCLGPADHVYNDALTLYDAAEHFEEEVILGPEDLDVDFATIQQTFQEMRLELYAAPYLQAHAPARSAWFQSAEANTRLRITWFSHLPCSHPCEHSCEHP